MPPPPLPSFLTRLLFGRASGLAARTKNPVPIALYGRTECPLCDDMEDELGRARVRMPYTLTKVDVDGDEALREAYGRSIPVLTIGGRTAFKGRMTATEFERKFERLARLWHAGGQGGGEER